MRQLGSTVPAEDFSVRRTPRPSAVRWILPVAGLVAIGVGLHNARDNEAALHVVPFASSEAELSRGIVRGLATFRPTGTYPVPPCIAGYKSGKNTKYTHFSGDNEVLLADGGRYTLGEAQKIEFTRNDPPRRPIPTALGIPAISTYLKRIKPDVKSFTSVRCLSETEPVWLEACARGEELVGCERTADPIVMTVGGVGPRKQYLTSHGQGAVALVLLGVTWVLLFFAWTFAHPREVISALARLRGVSAPFSALFVALGLGTLGCVVTSFTWPTLYGPWFFGAFVALVMLVALVLAVARIRVLGVAKRILSSTETAHLHTANAVSNELAVRVAEEAPLVEGFRAMEKHAAVVFEIVEDYERRSGSKTVTETRPVDSGVYPKHLPIADASGRGVLELAHCRIDAVSQRSVSWSKNPPPNPSWLTEVVGALEPHAKHRCFRAEWRTLEVSEPLLIYGGVERVLPSAVGARGEEHYRESPEVPVIRGREDAPAFAYVGLESELLRAIALERWALVACVLSAIGAVAAAATAFRWLLQQ